MLVLLWTDIFMFLIMVALICIIYQLRKRQDFKMAILQMLSSRTCVVTGLILLVYLLIGLADSIHYRRHVDLELQHDNNEIINEHVKKHYSEVESLLDYILKPWSKVTETTFSAPFALASFSKERIVQDDGTIKIIYPALQYVQEVSAIELTYNLILIIITSLLECLFLFKLVQYFIYKYNKKDFYYTRFAFKSFWLTLSLIIIGLPVILYLYKYFHVLGTDKIGTDILYISLKSIRTGLVIGTLTSIFMLPLALFFGTAAGYYGGKIDDLIQYLYTTLSSIPGVLLISAFILIIQTQMALHPTWFETITEQADIRLLSLCLILGITSWSGLCRLIRAETLKIREMDYVTAAKTMRVSHVMIIFRHVIPNLMHIVIINIVISFSGLVLAEAVLSYIGVGVDSATMSWGNMINSARLELSRDPVVWWPILGAFIPMSIFVLSLNLFADKLRDAFDPRARL